MHDLHDLLPIACRAASRVVSSPLLAAEAGERALHQLTLAVLGGDPPLHPKAWIRLVARRSACALLRSEWARTHSLPHEECLSQPARPETPPSRAIDRVREQVEPWLSARQRDALAAALSANSNRAAARQCGMQLRDFRRSMNAVVRKARTTCQPLGDHEPDGDDPAMPFRRQS